jgi:hypothetical protein
MRDADTFSEVIAALKALLAGAEQQNASRFNVHSANRFLWQLPGAWWGRWNNLHIRSDGAGELCRENFIADLSATIAYLETHSAKSTGAPADISGGKPGRQKFKVVD